MQRQYVAGTWEADRAFSPAVVTTGGKHVWLAGVGAWRDPAGLVLAGDFAAQVHATFGEIARTLERCGGRLSDIVTMTVYLADTRYGDEFTAIRAGYFPADFPASALIAGSGFARPEMLVEIQAIAVIAGD